MQNNSQYMMLNSKLKDSKKEQKKKEKKEKKEKQAEVEGGAKTEAEGVKARFERSATRGQSKFQQKYKTRIQQIKESGNPKNRFKKRKQNQPEEEKEFQGGFDYRDFISNDLEENTEEKTSSNTGKRGEDQ